MPGKIDRVYAGSFRKIHRSLNIVYAVNEMLMGRTCPSPFLSVQANEMAYTVVPAIIEDEDCRTIPRQKIDDSELAEHRAAKSVYPNDDVLWFLGPKPEPIQDIFLRRRYLNDLSRCHLLIIDALLRNREVCRGIDR